MPSGKEIRGKISSIKNTQKITSAMEMVAASKMRKSQERMESSRPYALKMIDVVKHLSHASCEYQHPFLAEREEVKRVGYIIVSTDRGLCGGLNTNLFRETLNEMTRWQDEGVEIDTCVIGSKAISFFKRFGNIVSSVSHLGDAPKLESLIGLVKTMLDLYQNQKIDRLYVVYNFFKNTMSQEPLIKQLIPIDFGEADKEIKYHWDYLYEPDSEVVVNSLLDRYIESMIYQAVVENNASEQAARMVAMKSATDNAGDMIGDLEMAYNKARQASITQELSEIVAGAAAV